MAHHIEESLQYYIEYPIISLIIVICSADTGEIIGIVEDRKFETLKKYFIRFTPQARELSTCTPLI